MSWLVFAVIFWLGAWALNAWLAGSRAGIYPDQAGFAESWALDRQFTPDMDPETRARRYSGWKDAIGRTLSR